MTPIYSVIIPVYNAEKYLDSSIESVLNQSSESAFEVILVNDGSRDGSAAICDRYAQRDARFLVIHQENQGVSAARNAGIAAAKGQYVLFLDSDDLWDRKLLEHVDGYISEQPDMIRFGYNSFSEKGIKQTILPAFAANGELGDLHFQQHQEQGVMPIAACWSAAFRRSFLQENRISFPLGIGYGEDFFFTMHCLKQAQTVSAVCEPLYLYRENELSVTHRPTAKRIRELLAASSGVYRLNPCALLADTYCMDIWSIADLQREDAKQVEDLLEKNRDILQHISGSKARVARGFYKVFGWYRGAKFLRILTDIRNSIQG